MYARTENPIFRFFAQVRFPSMKIHWLLYALLIVILVTVIYNGYMSEDLDVISSNLTDVGNLTTARSILARLRRQD
jgi:hypothetical protein